MPFVKVVKNKAFFKRFQVKLRRRREGKTDFLARRKMILQDKNKYNSPKYRLIIRLTGRKCICQVAYSTVEGDRMVTQALSTELPRYGCKVGLKNYSACYATGLLCGRRLLKKLGLDQAFVGVKEASGEEYHVEEEENDADKRPFKVCADFGIARTSLGARIFGALKGAVDSGLHVPHSVKKFPGFSPPEEKGAEGSYEAEEHKERIMGGHVKQYMEMLEEEDPTKYEVQFAKFIENDITAENIEEMYEECHKKIRENPDPAPKKAKKAAPKRTGNQVKGPGGKTYTRSIKLSLKQRKEKVRQKIVAALSKQAGGDDE